MSGHYSPSYNQMQSSQEFITSRHKLPTIPTPKPTSTYNSASVTHVHGANSSWMNKPSYPANNAKYPGWCSNSQPEKTDIAIHNSRTEMMDLSAASHTSQSSKSIVEPLKTSSINGDVTNIILPVNGSAKPKPVNSESVIVTNPRKSAHLPVKLSPKSNNTAGIVPSDKVESVLETMFESDTKSAPPVALLPCKSTLDIIGESVEKILKSPSPAKIEESSSETDNKPTAAIKTECDTNSPVSAKKLNNIPEKSQPHSNGKVQPTKSQLELALSVTSEKCDNSTDKHCINTEKVCSKTEANNEETYVEVESELAKMFAGIEDSETTTANAVTTKGATATTSTTNSLPNSSISSCRTSSHIPHGGPSSSANSVPPKRKPRKRVSKPKIGSSMKNMKSKQSSGKENSSFDSVTTKRVPVIHIEGSKENPISVQIINSIKTEEEDVSDSKMSAKRKAGKSDRSSKKLATDYVLKNYAPSSSDSSWVCVFCKLCAHSGYETDELSGDLFGPYFIRDPDKRENERLSIQGQVTKKQKRSVSSDSGGVDTCVSEEKSMEIWAHEDCFIWAPGVHLIGSKLMGLEEAVWDSLKTKCVHCGKNGANIGCRVRQCKSFIHYGCAIFCGWKLDIEKFLSICNVHAVPD